MQGKLLRKLDCLPLYDVVTIKYKHIRGRYIAVDMLKPP